MGKNPFAYEKNYAEKLQKQTYQSETLDCSPPLTYEHLTVL